MTANTKALVAAALAALAGCSYTFQNPAETLAPGEVGGRTVAGTDVVLDGVAVSTLGSGLSASSRQTGRFALLPLPTGRHTLMFRKGKDRALQRDVEIAFGKDGQPQGVWLGDVTLQPTAAIRGECALLGGADLAGGGVVVDEASGATAPVSGGAAGEFTLEGLAVGEHRLRLYAEDGGGQAFVGGPITVTIQAADGGTVKSLSRLTLHPASAAPQAATVKLRFAVAGQSALTPAQVSVVGLPVPVAFASDGSAQVELPEGRFTAALVLPPGAGAVSPPAPVSFVAVEGAVLDLGTLYAVTDSAQAQADAACHEDADCASGGAGSNACQAGFCQGWTPPPQAPAGVPWCDPALLGCAPGSGVVGVWTCAEDALGTVTSGVACGTSCTPDGLAVVSGTPGAGGCPALVTVPRAWTTEPSGTTAALRAVWGAGPGDVWAVGLGGALLHHDGVAWSDAGAGIADDLLAIHGSSRTNVWAAGPRGVYRYDGSAWVTVPGSSGNAVWTFGPDDVWVAGDWDGLGGVDHWDGLTWTSTLGLAAGPFNAVWGRDPSELWFAGDNAMAAWQGGAFASEPLDAMPWALGVWGAGGELWAVGGNGGVERRVGGAWVAVPSGESGGANVNAISGAGPGDAWAVSESGGVQRLRSGSWAAAPSGAVVPLRGVWAAPDGEAFAVGALGTILRLAPVSEGPPAYALYGRVLGAPAGVTLTLSGAAAGSAVTDAAGAFALAGLPSGGYTVTPSLAGWTFTPPSLQATIGSAGVTLADFSASPAPLLQSASGTVSGDVQQGVSLELYAVSTSTVVTATSGADGSYAFAGLAPGSYQLTPRLSGYAFTPPGRSVEIASHDVTGLDFTATATAGGGAGALTVQVGGAGQAGIQVELYDYNQDGFTSCTTGPGGACTFPGLAAGTYDLTPLAGALTFQPATRTVRLAAGVSLTLDFLAQAVAAPWTAVALDGTAAFRGLGGTSPTDVWAVGSKAGAAYAFHRNAFGWTNLAPAGAAPFNAVWADAPGAAWFGGSGLWRYDTGAWTDWTATLGSAGAVNGLFGFSPTDFWLVGSASRIYRSDGATFTPVTYPLDLSEDLSAVWGAASDDVWIVGRRGFVHHWNGRSLDSVPGNPVAAAALNAVWGSGPDDVWAVGAAGTVLRWDGFRWGSMGPISGPGATFNGVWGSGPADVWIAGSDGATDLLIHYDGTDFLQAAPGTFSPVNPAGLAAAWGLPTGEAWIAGGTTVAHNPGVGAPPAQAVSTVSGWLSGPVVAGVTVRLTGDAAAVTTTDAAGSFAFAGLADGRYVVVPEAAGAAFQPMGAHVTVRGADVPQVTFAGAAVQVAAPGACGGGEWCWDWPRPQGIGMEAVGGTGPGDLWQVGASGEALHWDGRAWTRHPTPTSVTMRAVWAAAPADVWAAGDAGVLNHWDGSAWTQSVLPTGALTGLWGAAAGDVWAVGTAAYHFDGTAWTASPGAPGGSAIWGAASNDVWTVRGDSIHHWNGSAWSTAATFTGKSFVGVWGSGPADVWVADFFGAVYRYDGSAWQDVSPTSPITQQAISGTTSSDVWIAGYGFFQHWDGSAWQVVWDGNDWSTAMKGLWLDPVSGDGAAVGDKGLLVTRIAGAWVGPAAPVGPAFTALAGSSAHDVWAVGDQGAAIHFDGGAWASSPTTLPGSLWAASAVSAADVWAVGDNGGIAHWDGAGWSATFRGGGSHLTAVHARGPFEVFAGNEVGDLYHFDGKAWRYLTTAPTGLYGTYAPTGLWATSASDLWITADQTEGGYLGHWDGTSWTEASTSNFFAVHGFSTGDVWAVGLNGAVCHWDGNTTACGAVPGARTLLALHGRSAGELWAVDDAGGAFSLFDGAWTSHPLGLGSGVTAASVWQAPTGEVWAGDILRHGP